MDPKSAPQVPAPTGNQINSPTQIPVKQTLAVPGKLTCKYCYTEIKDDFFFCPHCGKNIKDIPFKFSIFKTLGLIIFSILLPPLGIVPGFTYLRKKDFKAKVIGIILIVLSIIVTAAVIWFLIEMYKDMSRFWMELYSQQGGKATYENVTPENVYNQLNSLQQMSK